MISFKDYYIQQFKDVPKIWKVARKKKKYMAFFLSFVLLFFPLIIRTMWLYDTEQMKIDKRFNTRKE